MNCCSQMTNPIKPQQKLNHRQRRIAARHALHATKWLEARLLGVPIERLKLCSERTIKNIHSLQILINTARRS